MFRTKGECNYDVMLHMLMQFFSEWLSMSHANSPQAASTTTANVNDAEFKKYQQIAKEAKERERLLAEQQEQRRKEKEAEEAAKRLELEERARQREQFVLFES